MLAGRAALISRRPMRVLFNHCIIDRARRSRLVPLYRSPGDAAMTVTAKRAKRAKRAQKTSRSAFFGANVPR